MSRIPKAPIGASRIPYPGTSKIPTGNIPSRSRIPSALGSSTSRLQGPQFGRSLGPSKKSSLVESKLKKFDRSVNEELKRRRNTNNVLVAASTSDPNLREAVAHLACAEAGHMWAGAVNAAERAAASTKDPHQAEEVAAESARNFQTEIIDTIEEEVPGKKPIQVIGYIGITRPKRAAR